MAQVDGEVYARNLLCKGFGFPLWSPSPFDNLPIEYRQKGVSIGDVGIIRQNGSFQCLFNICYPADDPVNCHGVPDDFEHVVLPPTGIMSESGWHLPGSDVSSTSVTRKALALSGSLGGNPCVPAGFGAGFEWTSDSSQGAVLALPEGASRFDLQNYRVFKDQALNHAWSWYYFANVTLGCMIENGSLYLVTGCTKTTSWGVASFSTTSERVNVSLQFKAVDVTAGNASYSYTWSTHSPVAARAGPRRDPELGQKENQCNFVRGFKMTIREGPRRHFRRPVKISDVLTSKPAELLGSRSGSIPFDSTPSPSSGLGTEGSHGGRRQHGGMPDCDTECTEELSDGDIGLEHVPGGLKPFHPSTIINKYLLDSIPEGQVAVTHDDDWYSIITKDDTLVPDESELIARISRKFRISERSNAVFLVPLDEQIDENQPVDTIGESHPRVVETHVSERDVISSTVEIPTLTRDCRLPPSNGNRLSVSRPPDGQELYALRKQVGLDSYIRLPEGFHDWVQPTPWPIPNTTPSSSEYFSPSPPFSHSVVDTPPTAAVPSSASPKKKALLIGIQDSPKEDLESLHYPHRDVVEMQKVLIEMYGYDQKDIVVMRDGIGNAVLQPTQANIIREVISLVKDAQPGDHFLFHYAGHSTQYATQGMSEEDGQDEYLVPIDARGRTNVIKDNELRELLVDGLPVGSSLVAIFDTCYSEPMLDLRHYRCNRVYTPWISKGKRQSDPNRNVVGKDYRSTLGLVPGSRTSRQKKVGPMKSSKLTSLMSLQTWAHYDPPISPMQYTQPPAALYCTGHCDRSLAETTKTAYVLCFSACKDRQKAWENTHGESLTMAMIHILKEFRNPTLNDFMTHLSLRIHDLSLRLHLAARDWRKANRPSPGEDGAPDETWEEEMVNFQDPQLASHSPLDMDATFGL